MSTDPLPQSAHARTSSQPPSHSQSVRRECRQLGKPFFSSLPSFLSWRSRRRWRRRGSCWADPVTSDRRLYLFGLDGGKKKDRSAIPPTDEPAPSLIERTAGLLDRRALVPPPPPPLDLDINTRINGAGLVLRGAGGVEIDIRIYSANTEQSCRKRGGDNPSRSKQ